MTTHTATSIWLSAPRTVELREETVPSPGAGEVRARALVSAISHGTEMLVYRGQVPAETALDLPTLEGSFAFPIKYGYACVGQVIDVGPGVEGYGAGDFVFALHPHQSVFTAPTRVLAKLPNTLDPELSVFCANVETALNIAHDTPLHLGETAIVFGQGVVGLLVAQLLRMAGALRVFTVDPLPLRRDTALRVGVDNVFAPGDNLTAQVRAANDGRLADVAIEVSGNPAALQAAIDCVLDEGAVVVASWYGTKPVTLDLGTRFHRGRISLRSSQVGRLNPALGPRWDYARRFATVAALLPHLKLAELITHRFPIADAADAYALVDQHADKCGQVLLVYS